MNFYKKQVGLFPTSMLSESLTLGQNSLRQLNCRSTNKFIHFEKIERVFTQSRWLYQNFGTTRTLPKRMFICGQKTIMNTNKPIV